MRAIFAAALGLGLGAGGATAQEAPDSAPPSRRPAITGFAEASYTYSTRGDGDVIVGRLYDRFHDELLLGQNASVIRSGGFSLGDQGDIPHLYVTPSSATTAPASQRSTGAVTRSRSRFQPPISSNPQR